MTTPDAERPVPDDAHTATGAGADGIPELAVVKRSLALNVVLYTAARLMLVAAIVGVLLGIIVLLSVEVPLILLLAVAVVIQLPLSHLLLAGLRRRLTADMEVVGAQRREDKAELRSRLRGGDDPA